MKSLTVDGSVYAVKKGAAEGLSSVFTGQQVSPEVQSAIVASSALVLWEDYDRGARSYGENIAAGKNTAVFYLQPHYNFGKDSYEYGGRVPVKFTITDADGVKL